MLAAVLAANAETVSERLQLLTGGATDEILDPTLAFRLAATVAGAETIRLDLDIEDGYYLYRDKYSFTLDSAGARIDTAGIDLPRGETKTDEYFGTVEIHTGFVEFDLPLIRTAGGATAATLGVGLQGCKDKTICYPPEVREVRLELPAAGTPATIGDAPPAARGELSPQDRILAGLRDSGRLANLAAFFVFGLLLSFTPCVLPMLPILSGVILGDRGTHSARHGFALSASYVLALATVYALLGVFAGSTGFNVQAAAQAPWVITLFSAVFVVLALSMFDVFHLQLPAFVHARLHAAHARQRGGTLAGAAAMGALSALIAGPCVAPPLAAALLYISQSGDAVFGGLALFSLGLGFGAPLVVLGSAEGGLLPRSGAWMHGIKRLFGFVMLGVAVWFMGRILPGALTLALWSALLIAAAVFYRALDRPAHAAGAGERLQRAAALLALGWGVALLLGAAAGRDDPLRPLAGMFGSTAEIAPLPFRPIRSPAELDEALATAGGRPVMLDFYADWCVTCLEMERHTFAAAAVRERLARLLLLKADVTGNDAGAQALLRRFDLFGPPATLFFDAAGREIGALRVIGFVPPDEFAAHLDRVPEYR
jgi:thiol:disulfide interchange protein DsbD